MAAPTSVRVESKTYKTATLYWTHSGVGTISVYRALFGGSYSLFSTTPATNFTFTDTGVSDATRYSYKLSDDAGSTFSSVVSVVIQTAEIVTADSEHPHASPALPRVQGDTPEAVLTPINEAFDQIENAFAGIRSLSNSLDVAPCVVCSSNGAVIVDCRKGCTKYRVDMSEDVNSITLIGCGECPDIDFQIPSGASYGVCGWPAICGFEGDECGDPHTGPTTINSKGNTADPTFRAITCDCDEDTSTGERVKYSDDLDIDNLAMKWCPNDSDFTGTGALTSLSLNIAGGDGDINSAKLKACGGLSPYTWTITGNCANCAGAVQSTCSAFFNPTVTGDESEKLSISKGGACSTACNPGHASTTCVIVLKDFLLTTLSISLRCEDVC